MNKRIKEKIKKRHGYKSWKRYNDIFKVSIVIQSLDKPNKNGRVYSYSREFIRGAFDNDDDIMANSFKGDILHPYN